MKDIATKSKKLQLWLNQHYPAVRSFLIFLMAVLVIGGFFVNLDANRKIAEDGRRAVEELKNDNERQTQLIACLLAIHGNADAISDEDEAKCRKEANQQIENNSNNVNSKGETLTPES